jgi:hypothetical protein
MPYIRSDWLPYVIRFEMVLFEGEKCFIRTFDYKLEVGAYQLYNINDQCQFSGDSHGNLAHCATCE